jgi:iduronate 2-sulfatase
VELLDIYPTVAALAGLEAPRGLDGADLSPLLRDPGAPWSRPALTVVQRGRILGRSIRTDRWRFTEWDEGRRGLELYDHEIDPGETRNLAADPRRAETVDELRRLIRERRNPVPALPEKK